MRGYVYVLVNSSLPGLVKVGMTTRLPSERVEELSGPTGVPTPFIVAFEQLFQDCDRAEAYVHAALEQRGLRQAANREFFRAAPADVIRIVLQAVENDQLSAGSPQQNSAEAPWASLMEEASNYEFGWNGHLQDYQEAFRLYRDAARLGCPKAYERLGFFYSHGQGVREDVDRALEHLKQSLKLGYYYAYAEMMSIYASRRRHEANFHACMRKLIESRKANFDPVYELDSKHFSSTLKFYIELALANSWKPEPLPEIRECADDIQLACQDFFATATNQVTDKQLLEYLKTSKDKVIEWLSNMHRHEMISAEQSAQK